MRLAIPIIALLAVGGCEGTTGRVVVRQEPYYYDGYRYQYDYGPPPVTFYRELDAHGYWVRDPAYGVVYWPRYRNWRYAPTRRYGYWVNRPQLGRVWTPGPQYRREVIINVRPRMRSRDALIREHGRRRIR